MAGAKRRTATKIVGSLDEAARSVSRRRTVCCIGVFDGFHLGHQRLIGAAVAEARRRRCRSLVLTFRNHPLSLLAPAYSPALLTDAGEKCRRIAGLGPSLIAAIEFDHKIADLEPATFVEQVLVNNLHAVSVWCGADFRFGSEGRGDMRLLRRVGRRLGLSVQTLRPVCLHERILSSTWIRSLIERGDVEQASECLGRDYFVRGQVVRGHGRGRRLGYPTANLRVPEEIVLPGDGIYAVHVAIGRRLFDGVMHVGPIPTFGVTDRRLEVYLLNFHGSLIGQNLEVHFVARLRDVKHFDSPDRLVLQIKDDEQRARFMLRQVSNGP